MGSDNKEKNEVSELKIARLLILIGIVFIMIAPSLFTFEALWSGFDFSTTGQIGDTIGGITAPIANLVGAILVFFALKSQVKANEIISNQVVADNQSKLEISETESLNQLYGHLNESINNFRFSSLPHYYLSTIDEDQSDVSGGEAFYKLFSQIFCNYHGTMEQLFQTQAVSELYSVLTLMRLLLVKLESSISSNKEILITLVEHQFYYKITTRIREDEHLEIYHCESCNCNHGLPNELRLVIEDIRVRLRAEKQEVFV